jgi:hypothetical protein
MQRRPLDFRDYDDVVRDVERLHREGYRKAGQWDLAQTCDHLSYFIEGSLDGHTFRVPWLIRVLFGRMMLHRILKTRVMKEKIPTPQKPLPEPGGDEQKAGDRLKGLIERLKATTGELHPSPFFGRLTNEQWRQLHLIHCAHHLSFLLPGGTGNG